MFTSTNSLSSCFYFKFSFTLLYSHFTLTYRQVQITFGKISPYTIIHKQQSKLRIKKVGKKPTLCGEWYHITNEDIDFLELCSKIFEFFDFISSTGSKYKTLWFGKNKNAYLPFDDKDKDLNLCVWLRPKSAM